MNKFSLTSTRVLVVDRGTRSIKILLAAKKGNAVRVLAHRVIDGQGELSEPEDAAKFAEALREFGNVPVALSLPQNLSVSQVIDLPPVGPEEIKVLIREETAKFTGLSEGGIVYDYGRLNPFGKYQNPYWVTFAKEEEVLGEASLLPGVGERLCEIITPANALIASYQSLPAPAPNALLVELGATGTVLSILVHGQAAYALHYPVGGDAFDEAIAGQKDSSLESARALKTRENLFNETAGYPRLRTVVDGWRFELEKILQDWLRENPELNLTPESFVVVLGGDGAAAKGLLEHLRSASRFRFTPWPVSVGANDELPLSQFAVARGIALQSLGLAVPSASLFPRDLREARKRRHTQALLQDGIWLFLIALTFLLIFGTVQKLNLVADKQAMLKEAKLILQEAQEAESLHRRWEESYELVRPVMKQQNRTVETLAALAQLQQARGDKKLWYVLFADQRSYFAGQTVPPIPAATPVEAGTVTNPPPAKHGFIAELSLAEEGEAMRQTLSKVVSELKSNPAFRSVDTLSADQRRSLVNTNVILPGRHFALSIELAENTFENPIPGKPVKPAARDSKPETRPSRPAPRPAATEEKKE